jgi:ketosteroid isomerase-like protein
MPRQTVLDKYRAINKGGLSVKQQSSLEQARAQARDNGKTVTVAEHDRAWPERLAGHASVLGCIERLERAAASVCAKNEQIPLNKHDRAAVKRIMTLLEDQLEIE